MNQKPKTQLLTATAFAVLAPALAATAYRQPYRRKRPKENKYAMGALVGGVIGGTIPPAPVTRQQLRKQARQAAKQR